MYIYKKRTITLQIIKLKQTDRQTQNGEPPPMLSAPLCDCKKNRTESGVPAGGGAWEGRGLRGRGAWWSRAAGRAEGAPRGGRGAARGASGGAPCAGDMRAGTARPGGGHGHGAVGRPPVSRLVTAPRARDPPPQTARPPRPPPGSPDPLASPPLPQRRMVDFSLCLN